MSDPQAPAFVIGIDFGTTFTGACYALISESASKPTIIPVIKWPHAGKAQYPKTPTVSLYKKNEEGEYAIAQWGKKAQTSTIKEDMIRLSRFKLLLDSESGAENGYADMLPLDKLIADYLEKVVSYVKKDIAVKYPQFTRSSDSFRYCLTIPAMWDDAAKSIMRQAAVTAGLIQENDPPEKLILTSEPEAAALDCEMNRTENSLQDEDVIFICDAGGGTIDLTVYKVHYKENDEKYFEELTRGQGKSCGSSYIDDLARLWFKGHLENMLGRGSIKSHQLDEMTLTFSTEQKINFGSEVKDEDEDEDDEDDDEDDSDDIFIPLPSTLTRKIEDENEFIQDAKFKITSQQMKEFLFDPIVNEVLNLIDGQLQRIHDIDPSKIKLFLVGGFGQSGYLEKRIRETFVNTNRVGLLFVPADGGLSIARGAVLYGLDPTVITHRVSRRSYGVRCNRTYREGIDKPEYLIIGRDGKRRCKNRMDFFVKKNTQIESSYCVERDYYAFYPDNPNSVLYAYDVDGEPPDYVSDEGVKKIAKLNIIMPKIHGKRPNEKIKYKTKIYFGLTEIKFEVEICGQKQTYRASLDENDESNNSQPKSRKKRKSPGFENMIQYFKSKGFKTDHYRDKAQVASEILEKAKQPTNNSVRKKPAVIKRIATPANDEIEKSNNTDSNYFGSNPNPINRAELLPTE